MRKVLAIVVSALMWLGGCSTNPVTGKKELSIVGEDWELETGATQYSPGRQSQGGDYVADPAVQAYVNKIGQRLAAVSDRKLPYEFRVINSGVPNAWALPGGKIAINRGLLTEMKSEAELAAVLGHEIVHAAARHGARSFTRGAVLQTGILAATVATAGTDYSNIAQMGAGIGAQLINTRYGRDAERESDRFGIEYMAKAGYDPQGAVDLQQTFLDLSSGANRRQDFISGLFASHPPSAERLATNKALAASMPEGGEVGAEKYRQSIARLIRAKPAYEDYEKAKKALTEKNAVEARRLARRAISREPAEGHFHSFLGDIEAQANNFRAAQKHYLDAINLNDDFFYYHQQYGLVSEKTRDYAVAQRALNRSVQLLPTANAYNSLGNIAQATGRREEAVAQYSKAYTHNSPAGKQAYASLLNLDFPDNPGKYVVARYQVADNGTVRVQIQNRTPRQIGNIGLNIRYPNANGQMQQLNRGVPGVLAAGKSQVLDLPIRVAAQFARNVRVSVVQARIVR